MLIDRNRNCIERIRDCILHCKRQSHIHCILPRTEEKKAPMIKFKIICECQLWNNFLAWRTCITLSKYVNCHLEKRMLPGHAQITDNRCPKLVRSFGLIWWMDVAECWLSHILIPWYKQKPGHDSWPYLFRLSWGSVCYDSPYTDNSEQRACLDNSNSIGTTDERVELA